MLREAGFAIMYIYSDEDNFEITTKTDHSPLTKADTISNELISEVLAGILPDIPLISEETNLVSYDIRKSWKYVWLLDPLDGTTEFINRTDEFSINLALINDGIAEVGFIYLPVFQTLYYAIQGFGAYKIENEIETKISAEPFNPEQIGLRVVVSRQGIDSETKKIVDQLNNPLILPLGSALKLISIAQGDSDYYPRMIHLKEWDTAAGQVIIEEAGGSLVDTETVLPLTYNKASMMNPTFIASGKLI
ncbi:MAG: 3'(2'),5'-bisphosphate nucleotidase CysQ [Saprospiraceae bacterium]|nr:3'(2'),5'-bisphosphate nucleotidase CysQ [Saprospiraceae bacterium]